MVSLLTFGLIFTGFGLFVGLLIPLVFLVEAIQAWRQKQRTHAAAAMGGLLASLLSWWLFSIGYVFDPANADFHFPYEKPWEYFEFAAVMLMNFFGGAINNPLAFPMGLLLFAALTSICFYHAQHFIRGGSLKKRKSVVIFLLSAYALVYSVNTAIGRISPDWQTDALASRYVTLMIPAGMAIFLQLATLKRTLYSNALAILYALLILPGAWQLTAYDWDIVHVVHDRRIAWRDAFLATHDELQANASSNFWAYPRPGAIKNRLKFIEMYHLNFFKDVPPHQRSPAAVNTGFHFFARAFKVCASCPIWFPFAERY